METKSEAGWSGGFQQLVAADRMMCPELSLDVFLSIDLKERPSELTKSVCI